MVFREPNSEPPSAPSDPDWIQSETLVTIAGRAVESLDGDWRLSLDLFGEGGAQNWPSLDDAQPGRWDLPRDYEAQAGSLVQVPSCWNLNRPEWRYFEGTGWYTRNFDWKPSRAGERIVLRVGAAAYLAEIYLNGHRLGRHRGGSTPFCVELTEALRSGSN